MTQTEVLIAGAGPTGLVLALWLTKRGVKIRIVDKAAEAGTTSRALAVQARTLELYRQLGLADDVVAKGHRVPAVNLWIKGERRAHISLNDMGRGLTPYPFMHIFPQDEHEKLLIAKLATLGVSVERRTELVSFVEQGNAIVARLRGPDGSEQDCEATYLAGCDGARSKVRETIGTGFPGGTYRHVFYVADVQATGAALDGELHIDLDEADFVAIFPLAGEGRGRLIGTVRDERADRAETLTFDDVSSHAIGQMKVAISKVNWFSTYHVHHRVTEHFRKGRAFLVGDAAHIHSPAGGQGMNTGIGDAINLAWKLAAVVKGHAPASLLDSYEAERIGFARRLVATTDQAFTLATSQGGLAAFVRVHLVPIILPALFKLEAVRRFAFRTVSQTMINYRGRPLSRGTAGHVQGGDRLPWVPIDGTDNFAPLVTMDWQAHVYGAAKGELATSCEKHGLPLHVFAWRDEFAAAGLVRDALYLLRPDGYVALADAAGGAASLDRYLADLRIEAAPRSSRAA
jgi:2-polyprenyl-6-methoxyphenol hydroxylase-like FAD-dependent oxidoreductase